MSATASLPLNSPTFRGNEWKYIKECLDTAWVSSVGPFVTRFEREFAAFTGARHATATVNGTAALHLALRAVGVEHFVLSSDLGQYLNPIHTDGMKAFILGLREAGLSDEEIYTMCRDTPSALLDLEIDVE